MDLNQINQIIDRGYVWSILLVIAFMLVFIGFKDKEPKESKKKAPKRKS
jgi:hypothetical protein